MIHSLSSENGGAITDSLGSCEKKFREGWHLTLALKTAGFRYVETGDEQFQTGNSMDKVQGQVDAGVGR